MRREKIPPLDRAAEGNSAPYQSNVKASRPLTHDLIVSIFDRLEVEIARVVISDLIDNTFYASLYLLHNNKELHIDSRPSDAIAIAIVLGRLLWRRTCCRRIHQ
jgi:bifunctional DNase/RNase